MPVPQENLYVVEQAEKPVHKRLIENGATSELIGLYQVRSIDYPPLGRRGFTGSITYTTTTDFGEPADASWRCGDFT
ncbi:MULTISPECIES: hypothetical protein [unclassified Microcoleus]|uniref:hypothetical protein n=1 Tax=unclassified Microcoleus TaxID=2642155 RepID=UPI002FD2777D